DRGHGYQGCQYYNNDFDHLSAPYFPNIGILFLLFFDTHRGERLIRRAATGEELAEELVVVQTHGLDADDHAFETDDEDVADHDHRPVTWSCIRPSAGHGSKNEDCRAQTGVCHSKRANADVGHAVT